ncbi:MAG: hypothetical protein ABR545_13815 [Cyclonatronaceae bacterium]
MNKITIALFFVCLFILFQGCTTWHALEYETEFQPIQFGPHNASFGVDTLGVISGYYKQYSEDEVFSESENVSVALGGDEYIEENLSSTVYKALEDHPDHFIADGHVEVKVKRGITFWGFLKIMIAGLITNEESQGGEYSTEVIQFTGIVYRTY